jgi:hypothetical protein
MNTKEAWTAVGGLSKPSKMPGWAYGIPAAECKTGKKLQNVEGSTCYGCYALKGCYVFKVVQDAQYRRLASIRTAVWVDAMITLINSKKSKEFRWHDSGDVQDLEHLKKIYEVCKGTPDVKHWMPTREAWVKPYLKDAPSNLVIRFSMPMVDQEAAASWPNTSTVTSDHSVDNCPAFRTDKTGTVHTLEEYTAMTKPKKKELDLGHCGSCRRCWNPDIKNIAYGQH